MKRFISILVFTFSVAILAQQNDVASNKYWTQGKAEVNVYELSQNRYRENHPGQVVSVFVTEDFLTDKQVKNERYTHPNSTWILKNIQLKKFTTGVYDYSLFTSVFTPINRSAFPNTLKVTASSQEWCGTIFTQLNLQKKGYRYQQNSYFEKEGDVLNEVPQVFLEDEIYTVLRMGPTFLPTGDFKMLPALNFMQLKHLPNSAFAATAVIEPYTENEFKGEELHQYRVRMLDLKRELRIVFENKAPYKIVGWLDSFPSAFDKKIRTTKAVLTQQKMLAYWGLNSLTNAALRKELGLK
jgi:hypothetical protein